MGTQKDEPFCQTWLGISLQLVQTLVLIYLTIYFWTH